MCASRRRPRRPDFVTIAPPAEPEGGFPWEREFWDCWKRELEAAKKVLNSRIGGNDFWEGEMAAKELEGLGYFQRLIQPTDQETPRYLAMVLREISIYRGVCDRIVGINREFARFRKLLRDIVSKLRKFKTTADVTAPVVDQQSDQIQQLLKELKQKKEQFWNESLAYAIRELSQPFWDFEALQRGEEKIVYMAPEFASELDFAAFNWKIPPTLTKRANLDTRLQVRLALAFRLCLPQLSWRTVSRLVVLAYICGGLTKEENDTLLILNRPDGAGDAELTVSTVEKKLQKTRPDANADPYAYFGQE